MKIKLFAFLILFVSLSSIANSQVQVLNRTSEYESYTEKDSAYKEIGRANGAHAITPTSLRLSYKKLENDEDTMYRLTYINEGIKRVKDMSMNIDFSSKDNAFSVLYSEFKKIFIKENMKNKNYVVSLDLGSYYLTLVPSKILVSTYVGIGIRRKDVIGMMSNVMVFLSENDCDKLFWKDKKINHFTIA